ncbi:MAG: shikimate dehydrogenase [Chloroflexi bacterium]|nr:shikimate dehydrogenase [Chloroflexota bacterium]
MILTGLIGWPVGHSRSPAMHNAAFRAAGIEGVYVLLPVRPDRVEDAMRGLRGLGFRGANVTVPHKQAVIPYLDELSETARAIGAVNTIVVSEEGRLLGDNTDATGFWRDLVEQGIETEALKEGGALALGAGGSARAVAYALASREIPTRILARRPEQARDLVHSLAPHLPPTSQLEPHPWADLERLAPAAKLIVNCTPVGMVPNIHATPWPDHLPFRPDQILYDLVYNPRQTRLMRQARAGGARASNGLGMLIHQGALAWEQWTGQPAPLEAMRRAVSDEKC